MDAVIESIDEGKRTGDIALENPGAFIKFSKGIEKLIHERSKREVPDWRNVEVIVLTGPTGCGKTRMAHQESDIFDIVCTGSRLWFDGYEGQKTLLLDEFGREAVNFEFLLRLLDGYKMRLEVKGGFTYAEWTKVYITSNINMCDWYGNRDISALIRRVSKTITEWPVGTNVNVTEVAGNTIPPLKKKVEKKLTFPKEEFEDA